MRKGLKVLTISLIVTILIVVATAGTVLASGPSSSGDCTHPNCPNIDCPDCDGTCEGTGPMNQNGNGPQYQYRSGQI